MHTFLLIEALIMSLVASVFLIKGVAGMSVKDIAELSKSGYGYTLSITKNLARQKADTVVGAALLLLSFISQLVNVTPPAETYRDVLGSTAGYTLAIVVSAAISFAAWWVSARLQKKWYGQAKGLLEAKTKKER